MILSDILGADVVDDHGEKVGRLVDVRFRLEGRTNPSVPRVTGFIVSPRSAGSFLGYERTGFNRPAVLASLFRWIHRGSFFVAWESVARIDRAIVGVARVTLRPGYHRDDPSLPTV
jgi:sporulation protein YlmC with PRC-barrel domain